MKIISIGGSERVGICINALEEWLGTDNVKCDALIILPIPSTRDRVKVTDTDVPLSKLVDLAMPGVKIAGYGIPVPIRDEIKKRGAEIYDAVLDEEFLCENAKITAHGALGRILTETGRDLSELKIGLIGYGRIGSILYELLMFLGASVRLYSTSEKKITALALSGADVSSIGGAESFLGLDILINTAPKKIFTPEDEQKVLDGGTKIIELASGKNFSSERVTVMPSIPDRMYPLSSGRLYAKYIKKAFFD